MIFWILICIFLIGKVAHLVEIRWQNNVATKHLKNVKNTLWLTAGTRSFLISSTARCSLTFARFSVSSTVMRTWSSSFKCSQFGLPRFCSSCWIYTELLLGQTNLVCGLLKLTLQYETSQKTGHFLNIIVNVILQNTLTY